MIIKQRDAKAAKIPPQTLTDEFNLTMPIEDLRLDGNRVAFAS
jgi:hypothetical protein